MTCESDMKKRHLLETEGKEKSKSYCSPTIASSARIRWKGCVCKKESNPMCANIMPRDGRVFKEEQSRASGVFHAGGRPCHQTIHNHPSRPQPCIQYVPAFLSLTTILHTILWRTRQDIMHMTYTIIIYPARPPTHLPSNPSQTLAGPQNF